MIGIGGVSTVGGSDNLTTKGPSSLSAYTAVGGVAQGGRT